MKQQYDSYKPSGIDWIGDIPYHWNVLPLKRVCTMFGRIGYRGYTIQDLRAEGEGAITLSPSNMVNGGMDFGSVSYLSWEKYHESPEIKIQEGDILFVKTGSTFGKTSYVKGLPMEATINPQILRIVPKTHKKFLAYCMGTPYSQALTDCYVVGSTIPTISQESIGRFMFPIPPLAEQKAIAAWLDEKCEEIDAAIAKVDREIELIDELKQSEISRVVTRGLNPDAPLRPSGIDWIGDIPEHWTKCRFKNFMYLKTKPSCSQVKVGLENLESGSGKFIESDTEFEGNGVEFCHSDILYGKLRPYLRKVWLAEFSGNAVGDFFIFGNYSNSAASYLKYLLLSDGFTKQADGSTFGAKMPRVSSEFILTLPFYLPPLTEQQAIADYLDKKCVEIDELKAKLTKKRETLTELRQSIISEVVTGKRKVI